MHFCSAAGWRRRTSAAAADGTTIRSVYRRTDFSAGGTACDGGWRQREGIRRSHATGAAEGQKREHLSADAGIIELTGVADVPDEEGVWSAAERLALCAFR